FLVFSSQFSVLSFQSSVQGFTESGQDGCGGPPSQPGTPPSTRGTRKTGAQKPHFVVLSARFWSKRAKFGAILHEKKAPQRVRSQTSPSGSPEAQSSSPLDSASLSLSLSANWPTTLLESTDRLRHASVAGQNAKNHSTPVRKHS